MLYLRGIGQKITTAVVCVIYLFSATPVLGQFHVSGKIIHETDGQAIAGAVVQLAGTHTATTTNKNGLFVLSDLEAGRHTLEVSIVGFQTKFREIEISDKSLEGISILLVEKIFHLPQVVIESITMTGGLSSVNKSLGSAHFIGQKEIQKFSYTDINRTIRHIPGVNIQEEDGYGLRPNIGLRATGSERSSKITIMEDGILAAPAPYAAPAAYYFPTIGRMEAVEIQKGSSQIKYGPFTTGGAINLISTPIPTSLTGHADLIVGTDAYRLLHANIGNAHKNVAYLVETVQYGADGFKKLDGGGNTGFHKQDYLAKVRLHTNPEARIYQSLTLKWAHTREKSNETYLGLTDADFVETPLRRYAASQEDLMKSNYNQMSLTHYVQLSSFLDMHTSLYSNDFERNWYKLDKVNGNSISKILNSESSYIDEMRIIRGEDDSVDGLALKANNRSYFSRGIQTNAIFHKSGKSNHKLDLSVRYHEDQMDRYQWVDSFGMKRGKMTLYNQGIQGTESNRIESAQAISAYGLYKWETGPWTITPGLRFEKIDIKRENYGKSDPERQGGDLSVRSNQISIWIPGFGAAFDMTAHTQLFVGLHKGFAPPGSKEDTKPEESWNYEAGARWKSRGIKFQALAYYNDYSNLLGIDLAASGGQGTQQLFNGGKALAKGLEAELSYDLLHNRSDRIKIPIQMAYTYSNATFESDFESDYGPWSEVKEGDHLPYVPTHQLANSISIEHPKYLFDISARYSSSMLTEAGRMNDGSNPRTDIAFTVDVALNYKLSSHISVFANVNNIFNNVYIVSRRPSGVRPSLPRSINLGLKANF